MFVNETLRFIFSCNLLKKPKSIRSPNSFALLENLDEKVEAVSPRASAIVSHKEAVVRGEKKLHDPIVWVDLEMTGFPLSFQSYM